MKEAVFVVREVPEGWLVENGATLGPFFSKERAMDLAEGMAVALRATEHSAEVVVADDPDTMSS